MLSVNFRRLKSFGGTQIEQKLNAVVDALQATALNNGVGYSVATSPNGSTLKIASATTITSPFDVIISTPDPASPTAKALKFVAGSVNQLLPSNIFSTFTFTSTDVVKVKLRAVSDGQKITSATMVVDATDPNTQTPTPFGLPTSVDILISVIVNAIPTRLIETGQSVTLTGQQQFIIDKSTPAVAGQLNYIPYFTWIIQ